MILMFITNNIEVAQIAERAGVDRIFIDLETVGKQERQGGMDTVQSHHTVEDVRAMRAALRASELFVRVNPIYEGSEQEIHAILAAGAQIIMLPYFKTPQQVAAFLSYVDGRARTSLLFETPESIECLDEILALDGIDECYIGLNDLHLGYHRKFMFELLADGIVDHIISKFQSAEKRYGFGGVARMGTGLLSADQILGEHVRLRSSMVILSRSFCDVRAMESTEEIAAVFGAEVPKIRTWLKELDTKDPFYFTENHRSVQETVARIVENK